jgi:hypothetical protein
LQFEIAKASNVAIRNLQQQQLPLYAHSMDYLNTAAAFAGILAWLFGQGVAPELVGLLFKKNCGGR